MKSCRFDLFFKTTLLVLLFLITISLLRISSKTGNGRYIGTSDRFVILDTKTGEFLFSYNGKLSKFPGENEGE